jgi:DNA polymerase II small subunit/DNA polymerase delta subunit B
MGPLYPWKLGKSLISHVEDHRSAIEEHTKTLHGIFSDGKQASHNSAQSHDLAILGGLDAVRARKNDTIIRCGDEKGSVHVFYQAPKSDAAIDGIKR